MAAKSISIKTSLIGSAIVAAAIILIVASIGVFSLTRVAAADK